MVTPHRSHLTHVMLSPGFPQRNNPRDWRERIRKRMTHPDSPLWWRAEVVRPLLPTAGHWRYRGCATNLWVMTGPISLVEAKYLWIKAFLKMPPLRGSIRVKLAQPASQEIIHKFVAHTDTNKSLTDIGKRRYMLRFASRHQVMAILQDALF